jgi:antitoxin component of RelBE/YafQ-DinJ toxin-antitoxin module
MDAMVTARMPEGKKEAGAAVLKSLNTSASGAINQLYDYVISHRALPFAASEADAEPLDKRLREAAALVDGLASGREEER